MSIRSRACAALFVLLAATFSAAAAQADISPHPDQTAPPPPPSVESFDGLWEGKIFFDKEAFLAPTSTPAEGATFRIEIHGPVVRIFAKEENGFAEVKAGMFHIAPVSANAVIFATEAPAAGPWVESWVFVVTQKDDHTLIVEYSRLVNNVGTPLSDPESKFATRGAGEFVRVPEPKSATQ